MPLSLFVRSGRRLVRLSRRLVYGQGVRMRSATRASMAATAVRGRHRRSTARPRSRRTRARSPRCAGVDTMYCSRDLTNQRCAAVCRRLLALRTYTRRCARVRRGRSTRCRRPDRARAGSPVGRRPRDHRTACAGRSTAEPEAVCAAAGHHGYRDRCPERDCRGNASGLSSASGCERLRAEIPTLLRARARAAAPGRTDLAPGPRSDLP